ncbi:IS3 family transposase [Paracoccus sp. SCSIO 75233]|uniref:IS3 family transposase n=1 Tax=Paracoccus sp. SCSIO 75233 TaxID=3017782 RepID=UPI0034A04C41
MGVSRSGFHACQAGEPSARDIADRELTELIRQIHAASRDSYGAPRIHAELADSGTHVGRERVERLMKAVGLAGVAVAEVLARRAAMSLCVLPLTSWTATFMRTRRMRFGLPTSL